MDVQADGDEEKVEVENEELYCHSIFRLALKCLKIRKIILYAFTSLTPLTSLSVSFYGHESTH